MPAVIHKATEVNLQKKNFNREENCQISPAWEIGHI
jgi:hypothetical protein